MAKFFVLAALLVLGVATASPLPSHEDLKAFNTLLSITNKHASPEALEEALEIVRGVESSAVSSAVQQQAQAAQLAANCVVQARNTTLFDDTCGTLLGELLQFGTSFSQMSSNVNVTADLVNSICHQPCFQRFINFVAAWNSCLSQAGLLSTAAPGATSAASNIGQVPSIPASMSSVSLSQFESGLMTPLVSVIAGVANLFCLRNENGQLCMPQLQQMQATITQQMIAIPTTGTPTAQASAASTAMCSALSTAGCCFGAYMAGVSNIVAQVDATGQATAELNTAMSSIQTMASQQCGLTNMPTSCTPNPTTAAVLKGVAKLNLLWSWWSQQSPAKQQLVKTALCTDLASAGGFYANLCNVTGVAQASGSRRLLQSSTPTAFNYQVLGTSTTALASTQSALSGNVSFTDVSAASGQTVTGSTSVQSVASSPGGANTATTIGASVFITLLFALAALLAL